MTTLQFLLYALAANAGIALHFLKKLWEFEQSGTLISPKKYFRERPYGTAVMVLSAWALCAVWVLMGDPSAGLRPSDYALALLTGSSCNSAFDALRARAEAKLRV